MPAHETLSPLDAFFLYLESPATPMHTGSVALFEGAPLRDEHGALRMDDIRAEIAGRLDLVPKLRRRVRFPVGAAAAPVWVDDPEFDIDVHVRHLALPVPGTEAELAELCAELMAVPLDRARPLWEMCFVEGLRGGRVALVEKLHHALADGLAGVDLATVLLDVEPRVLPHRPARPWSPLPAPAPGAVLARDVVHRGRRALEGGARLVGGLRDPRDAARRQLALTRALATFAHPVVVAPPSSLNVPVSQGRRLALVRQAMSPLRNVERCFGTTLNDVVLAAVTGGLRRLLASRGEPTSGRSLIALVPVGVDHGGDHRLGNDVSALFVPLPVGLEAPAARLRAVADAVRTRKAGHQSLVGERFLGVLDAVPPVAVAKLTPLAHRQRLCNLVVTNVPGPRVALYAMGARMLEVFPVVPLGGNLSVGVAVFSYQDQLTLGITAARDQVHDLEVLVEGIEWSFAELVRAAASPGGRHRRPRGMPRDVPGRAPRRGGADRGPAAPGGTPEGSSAKREAVADGSNAMREGAV